MKRLLATTALIPLLGISFVPSLLGLHVYAQEEVTIELFYSETCPHCIAEQGFLDDLQEEFPDVTISRYSISDTSTYDILQERVAAHGLEKEFGLVPMTFVGGHSFVGFDTAEETGAAIRASFIQQLENGLEPPGSKLASSETCSETVPCTITEEERTVLDVPFIGEVNAGDYSLPLLAIILGVLDGFNVCSLGALVLILGFVMVLKSRAKIMLFGGLFLLVTGVVYATLIFLWNQLFVYIAPHIGIFDTILGLLGVIGGIYFFRQFLRFRKYGPTCDIVDSNSLIGRATTYISDTFKDGQKIGGLVLAVIVFAFVITVVEFPCSAVLPVAFAGVLADAGVSTFGSVGYIGLFTLFYLLDELIIFGIAVYKLSLWLAKPKFVVWITLIEAIVLFGLGAYYLLL